MHAVARHLAKNLAAKAPSQSESCFQYNQCFFTSYNGRPATVEEYVFGAFIEYEKNTGQCVKPGEDWSEEYNELCAKAQSLVHSSYQASEKNFMLLDIQGSKHNLYDPEIATPQIVDDSSSEFYFCFGSCTLVGINEFLKGQIL